MKEFTAKQRADIYLELAKMYDAHLEACGVCSDFGNFYGVRGDLKQSVFNEWWLFKPRHRSNTETWWKDFSKDRVLALLFAHQMALNP